MTHTVATVTTAACWGLFGVVWLTGALYNARHGPPARTRRTAGIAAPVGVLVVWLLFRAVPDWNALTFGATWPRAIGLVVLLVATAFTLWARVVLGRMWSSSVLAKRGHELRTDGPYAITRHPIYTGMLSMLLGSTLLNGGGRWLAGLLAGLVVAAVKVRAEERLMSGVFPDDYAQYRRRVPQLVPGLKPPAERRRREAPSAARRH